MVHLLWSCLACRKCADMLILVESSMTVRTVGVHGCLSLILLYFCVVLSYRTYRRPRYKVAYKMVTEMEWKCCHGYSGEDCHDGPKVATDTQVNGGRPRVTQTGHNTGGGQRGDSRDGERTRHSPVLHRI